MQKHHKRILNHTRITPAQQEPSCRLGKPLDTHTKLEKDQTSVVVQPCVPQNTFSKLQTKSKASRIDPRSILNNCNTYDWDLLVIVTEGKLSIEDKEKNKDLLPLM